MSQGLIGYDLQNAVHTELLKHGNMPGTTSYPPNGSW